MEGTSNNTSSYIMLDLTNLETRWTNMAISSSHNRIIISSPCTSNQWSITNLEATRLLKLNPKHFRSNS